VIHELIPGLDAYFTYPLDWLPLAVLAAFVLVYSGAALAIRATRLAVNRPALIVLQLLAVVLFFTGEEVACRYVTAHPGAAESRVSYQPHPIMWWRTGANMTYRHGDGRFTYRTNAQGMRGDPVPEEKAPGEIRILCYGDSWTFGFEVKDEETYEAVLEQELSRLHPDRRIRVINQGCEAYCDFQELLRFQHEGRDFHPDAVIFSINHNTYVQAAFERLYHHNPGPLLTAARPILYRVEPSAHMRRLTLKARIVQVSSRQDFPGREFIRSTYRLMIDEVRRYGAIPLFLAPGEAFNDLELKEWIAGQDVPLVNVEMTAGDLFLSYDPGHPSPKGYRVIAAALRDALERAVMPSLTRPKP